MPQAVDLSFLASPVGNSNEAGADYTEMLQYIDFEQCLHFVEMKKLSQSQTLH
jgi:hypothetical protein